MVGGELAREQARVGRFAKADGNVKILVARHHRLVGEQQLDIDGRVAAGEFGNGRSQLAATEAEGGVDAQQAARLGPGQAERLFQGFDFAEDAPAFAQVKLAFRRQAHAPRRARQQADAEALFQLTQAATDGSRAQAEFARSAGQAAVLDKEGEEGEIVGHGF